MHIVFVCLRNFQCYILDNIHHLVQLGEKEITVITNRILEHEFLSVLDNIHLVFIEDYQDSYDFNNKTNLDNEFRNGFWRLTSQRFFSIYEWMKRELKLHRDVL